MIPNRVVKSVKDEQLHSSSGGGFVLVFFAFLHIEKNHTSDEGNLLSLRQAG